MICQNIDSIQQKIAECALKAGRNPDEISLIAVSKFFPAATVSKAIDCGHTLFGENYIQEVQEKHQLLGESANFHFIGNLQSNKAKQAAQCCSMVETVDRLKIAKALNKQAIALDKDLDILIQVNIGEDENKSGTTADAVEELLRECLKLEKLRVRGLMTIPPLHCAPEDSRPHFRNLRLLSEDLKTKGYWKNQKIELSMGMSNDYHIAIEEGATIIRIGTSIFGKRP